MKASDLNVLLVSSYLPVGGGISAWTEKYLRYFEKNNLHLHLVDLGFVGRRSLYKKYYFDEFKRTLRILRDMKKSLKTNKFDVVHINTSCAVLGIHRDAWCIRFARRYKVPVVLHCRCNVEDQLRGLKLSIHAFKQMVNSAEVVLTLNQTSLNYVDTIATTKSIIIPNFIEDDYCTKKEVFSETLKEILFVGHVKKEKGIFELIEAAKHYPQIHFTVIGPPSLDVHEEDIPTNVSLLGNLHHDAIKEYYLHADLFLFPSYTEGFSNAMLEAMASGLPIIASNVGANKDMIEDHGGIIVEPQNSSDVIKAIEAMQDVNRRKECSMWNYNKVLEQYTVDKVMNQLLGIYKTICST